MDSPSHPGSLPAHLRPGGRVPLEARPLEARRLLHGLLGDVAVSRVAGLDLPVDDLQAEHDPLLHAPAARGVTLRGEAGLAEHPSSIAPPKTQPSLQAPPAPGVCTYPLPVLRQPVRGAVLVPAGMDGQRLCLQVAL